MVLKYYEEVSKNFFQVSNIVKFPPVLIMCMSVKVTHLSLSSLKLSVSLWRLICHS